uniref:Uncharacterized protein n=1 Tax=Panagrolaimus sp. JU765 TaxID=591449 RepID=A0AC34RGT9_9BILA
LIDNTMINVEAVLGYRGHHWIRNTYERFHSKILHPVLVKKDIRRTYDRSNSLVRTANKLAAKEAEEIAEFSHDLEAWYENVRSRTVSMLSYMPNDEPITPNGTIPNGHLKKAIVRRATTMAVRQSLSPNVQFRPRSNSSTIPISILKPQIVVNLDENDEDKENI